MKRKVPSPTISYARYTLDRKKIITARQAAKVWGQLSPKRVPIRYRERDLWQARDENRPRSGAELPNNNLFGETEYAIEREDWRLVFIFGFSLREQRQIRGVGSSGFCADNDWWLEPEEDEWATDKPKDGYYLINFEGRYGGDNWYEQEKGIGQSCHKRAHEAVISEAAFSIYQTHRERLLRDRVHWGRGIDSRGNRVGVGNLGDHKGLSVIRKNPSEGGHCIVQTCIFLRRGLSYEDRKDEE